MIGRVSESQVRQRGSAIGWKRCWENKMNNEEMKRSLRELCRIESVAGIDVSDDAPYGAGCAQALDYALASD